MSNYRRAKTKGGTYFFTVVLYRRQNILCHDDMRHALREAIEKTRETHPFIIDAWVLLPDHLHCIWTLPEADENYSSRWAMIKRHVTKQCAKTCHREDWMNNSKHKRKESTIWQRRFWEHQIGDEDDFQRHMNYIHYNPVKHGYVVAAKEWPYSSFHRYIKSNVYPSDWGNNYTPTTLDAGEP